MKRSWALLMLVLAILVLPMPGQAQVSSGVILGVVGDASGALIPGVTITVTNEGTNQSRQSITNEVGNYRVEPLQVGVYTVTAELSGFRKEIRRGVTVNVDARVRLDFALQVGQLTEVIEVSAQSPVVQTDDSQVGQVMDQRKIADLPLNGRNFSSLAYLTPGAFAPRPGSHLSDRGGFVAAGLAEKTNQFLVDGVNNNGAGTMESAYRVNIDTVGEFKIQTQNYTAQYGRYAGAQVDAILKSGTNEFHGTIFGFTRNDNLDARNFFDPWPLDSKPEFKRHQYGGAFGGPILRDKAFFFAGFQGQRQTFFRRSSPTVPFPEYWSGDLSRLNKVIRDPATGQPFPNGRIPANRLDPIAQKFRSYYFVEPNKDTLARNANALLAEPEHFWQPDLKINWSLNENHQLIGSWGYYKSDLLEFAIANRPELPNYHMFGKLDNQRYALQEIWTISPTIINELRGGISRVNRIRLPFLHDKNYARDVFGITGTVGDVDPIGNAVPRIAITGYSSLSLAGTQPRVDGNWSVVDTLTIQKGNHSVKFGGDVFRQYMNLTVLSSQAGNFNFTGANTGDAFADFLLGLPFTSERAFPLGPISQHPNRWSSNFFVQDDWKASQNLTINYGLRWELTYPMDEKWGRLATFDPKLGNGVGGIRLADGSSERYGEAVQRFKALYPTVIIQEDGGPFYKTDKDNWAPRLGFAWTPGGRNSTVVRGGYGIFYTLDALTPTGYYNLAPFMLTQRFALADRPTLSNPWPGVGVAGTINVVGVDFGYENGMFQHWNLGVQREVPGGVVLDVAYVGKKGNQIDATRDINQPIRGVKPYPLFGPITFTESRGNASYHGLQTRVEKRSASGLTVLLSYAWSKLIDDVGANGPVRDSYNLKIERGLGQEDARHRLSASYVWALPFGQNKRFLNGIGTAGNAILGNWELSGILRATSGSPLTPTITVNNSGYGRNSDRPDLIGNPKLDEPHPTTGWFNRAAFAMPAPGSVGNAGTGSLIGPGYIGTDFSLLKRFAAGENKSLQFRLEIFNALNQSNFFPVATIFGNAAFGTTGTALENRQVQLGMKYIF